VTASARDVPVGLARQWHEADPLRVMHSRPPAPVGPGPTASDQSGTRGV